MRRSLPMTVAGAAALCLTLAACTGGSTGRSAAGVQKTLTLGMAADIQGWDPSNQPGYQGWAGEAVWDTVIRCDEFGKPLPAMAETWEISDDQKSFTAHLREGMTFTDGTAADAEDVKATFEFVSQNGGAQGNYAGIALEVSDANTITASWPEPQAQMINRMCAPKITSSEVIASGEVNDVPLGSGPYILDEKATTRGSVYSFTKNEAHWNADSYPYQKLVLNVYDSETAALNALKTGQIDGTLINAQTYDEVVNSGFKVATMNGQTTRLLLTDHLGQDIPALGDVRVRQAMNMVFDKEAMVKSLYTGHGKASAQIFREGSDAYIDDLTDPYPFDVDKAKALMKEAGYENGFTLQLPTMAGQNHDVLMPYVTQQLAELNITVEQVPLSGANAISDLLSGTYPVVLWQLGNLGDSLTDIDIVVRSTGYWNLKHQDDAFIEEQWSTILTGDESQKKDAQQAINQYVIDQAWFVPMVNPDGFYAHTADVKIPHISDVEGLSPKLIDFQ
ncbi:ABC transporter substrate-binding protein [Schaalia vaccimaxillae]|uniref:ABC transporter substrate-binding protein n=1 Tax=Schaalia vaccimaxillae TaxID=183916 RepID=UPI00040CF050|nr:ABC transporter substrate-binding protein [Schaalia vaccimaxillae]